MKKIQVLASKRLTDTDKVEISAADRLKEKADTPSPLMKGQVGGLLDIMRDKDSEIWKIAQTNGECGENMEQTLKDFYEFLEDQE